MERKENDKNNELRLVVFDLDYTIWDPEMYEIYGPPKLLRKTKNKNKNKKNESSTGSSTKELKGRTHHNRSTRSQTKRDDISSHESIIDHIELTPAQSIKEDHIVTDQTGTPITIFDGAAHALAHICSLNLSQQGSQDNSNETTSNNVIQIAAASKTDRPQWANQCMDWLTIPVLTAGGGGDESQRKQKTSQSNNISDTAVSWKTLSQLMNHVEIHECDKKLHFDNLYQKTGIPYENMLFFDNEYGNIRSVKELGVKCIYTPDGMTRTAWSEGLSLFEMNVED